MDPYEEIFRYKREQSEKEAQAFELLKSLGWKLIPPVKS